MGPAGSRGHRRSARRRGAWAQGHGRPGRTYGSWGVRVRENLLCLCPGSLALALPPPSPAPRPRPSTPRPNGFPGEFGPHVSVHAVHSQLVSVPVAAVDRMLVSPQFTR